MKLALPLLILAAGLYGHAQAEPDGKIPTKRAEPVKEIVRSDDATTTQSLDRLINLSAEAALIQAQIKRLSERWNEIAREIRDIKAALIDDRKTTPTQ